MYTDNRTTYRKTFYDAWQKYQKQMPLEALETQMVEVLSLHPEYHSLLADEHRCLTEEFDLEENPFFHLSLHISLLEQIRLDQPAGIKDVYHRLISASNDKHATIHQMMQCLAQCLWQAQQTQMPPNELEYLEKLRHLVTMEQ